MPTKNISLAFVGEAWEFISCFSRGRSSDLSDVFCSVREATVSSKSFFRPDWFKKNPVARITRPDLNYDMVSLSTKFKGGKVEDLKAAKKVLANIVQNEATITLSCVGNLAKAELWLYTDASFGNLNESVEASW